MYLLLIYIILVKSILISLFLLLFLQKNTRKYFTKDKVIITYTIHNHNVYPHLQAQFLSFNSNHSPERMTSEHGVNHMKDWGDVRRRSDIRLFENEEQVEMVLKVVQAIHYFSALNCPQIQRQH